jgi:hypothetical protein
MDGTRELLMVGLTLVLTSGARASTTILVDGRVVGRTFDGIGAISGGGGNSRLLVEYPEPSRSEILDYLFKPNYGASLQLLKVEIGGDANSTSGAEPSHMHSSTDENYFRGYEWWIMEQAKARNPDIQLLALEWTAPGWIGGSQNFWSQDNIDYIVKWINGAKRYHNLTIDYVGGWNECYTGWNREWFKNLKRALAANGLATKIIGVDEYYSHLTQADRATISNSAFYEDIDIIAAHYPCDFGTIVRCSAFPPVSVAGKAMWASESGDSAIDIARTNNLMYLDGKMTASIIWPLVGAVYENFPISDGGLILAREPWTGGYQVRPGVWAIAHTTQFVQPGWQYLESKAGTALGSLSSRTVGSYVAFKSPNGSDYSVVLETAYASAAEMVNIVIAGGLSAGPVHVWSTNLKSLDPDQYFVHEQTFTPVGGSFWLPLQPGYLYSVTTTTGQGKGNAGTPASDTRSALRLPYSDDFGGYEPGQQARLLSDVNGAFEIAPCGGGRAGLCLRQMAEVVPYFWWATPQQRKASDPYTLMGNPSWADYQVSADVLLEHAGAVQLIGRASKQMPFDPSHVAAYFFELDDRGTWAIVRKQMADEPITLTSGLVAPPGGAWHRMTLAFSGTTIRAELDGQLVGTVEDAEYRTGQVGLGVGGWSSAQFDNLSVTPVRLRRGPAVRRR